MLKNPFEQFILPNKLNNKQCVTAITQYIISEPRKAANLLATHNIMPALDYCNWKLLAKVKYTYKKTKYRLKVFDCMPYNGKLRVRFVQNTGDGGLFIKFDTSGNLNEVLEKKYHKKIKDIT